MKSWKLRTAVALLAVALIMVIALNSLWLGALGRFLVHEDDLAKSDAVVVLNTGVEIYPRLMQAAEIYRGGWAQQVVVNGNRKSDELRKLENMGFEPGCPWYENHFRILSLLGVPRQRIRAISAENAYDTISEAVAVGEKLADSGIRSVLIVTSKYHSRRAGYIWKRLFGERLSVRMVAAQSDPFAAGGWWKEGRQIRWVLAEYGAWPFGMWKLRRLEEP